MTPEEQKRLGFEAGRVFTPAAPIDEKTLFAGRKEQLRKVVDTVNQRGQHAIIFGERGVGKTSMANVLSSSITAGIPVLAPHVNCDSKDTHSSLWLKVLSEIQLSREIRPAGFGTEPSVTVTNPAENLPKTLTAEDVRRVLIRLSQGAILLLIIDEFDRLSDPSDRRMFADTIKTLSDHSVGATVVLVGVADTVEQLIGEHQSVERALVQIPMPRMSVGELEEIVKTGLSRLEMEIEPEALVHISSLSQGLPHYTHLLGLHAARRAIDRGELRVTLSDVDSAIKVALDQAQQSVRGLYNKAIRSPRKESLYAQVLLACALSETDELGYFPAGAVKAPMSKLMKKPYDIPSFSRHLYDFCEAKRGPVLEKIGGKRTFRFRFINPLMQPFVTMRGLRDGLIERGDITPRDRRHKRAGGGFE